MNSDQREAKELLETLIKNQPQLFASVHTGTGNDGSALADFCANFIQRYSEHRKKMDGA